MGVKGGPAVKVTFKDLVYADHSGTGCHCLHLFLMSENNMKELRWLTACWNSNRGQQWMKQNPGYRTLAPGGLSDLTS